MAASKAQPSVLSQALRRTRGAFGTVALFSLALNVLALASPLYLLQVYDRVLVTGRRSLDEINVGGAKVAASVVRTALVAHPQVAWARVRGRRAPLMGEVVAADVVLRQPVPEGELRGWLSARLPEHAVPRFLRVLPEIPVRDTLKSDV